MSQNRRENTFRIITGPGEFVGVAQTGCLDFHQHFASARAFQLNGCDFQRFACLKGYSCFDIHRFILRIIIFRKTTQLEQGCNVFVTRIVTN